MCFVMLKVRTSLIKPEYGLVSGQLEASKRAAQTLESRSRDLEVELSQLQKANEQLTGKAKSSSENLRQRVRHDCSPNSIVALDVSDVLQSGTRPRPRTKGGG